MKVLILILTCNKNRGRLNKIKLRWISKINDCGYEYMCLYANKNIVNTIHYETMLCVNCNDVYENLPLKLWLAYKYVLTYTDYDYIYKIDDDCLVNMSLLPRVLEVIRENKIDYYGNLAGGRNFDRDWHCGKCNDENLNMKLYEKEYKGDWCAGGIGYILSKKSLKILSENITEEYIKSELYEDKAMGDMLRANGILPSFEINNKWSFKVKKGNLEDLCCEMSNEINTVYDIYT